VIYIWRKSILGTSTAFRYLSNAIMVILISWHRRCANSSREDGLPCSIISYYARLWWSRTIIRWEWDIFRLSWRGRVSRIAFVHRLITADTRSTSRKKERERERGREEERARMYIRCTHMWILVNLNVLRTRADIHADSLERGLCVRDAMMRRRFQGSLNLRHPEYRNRDLRDLTLRGTTQPHR